jgi:hypothetical protein
MDTRLVVTVSSVMAKLTPLESNMNLSWIPTIHVHVMTLQFYCPSCTMLAENVPDLLPTRNSPNLLLPCMLFSPYFQDIGMAPIY